jgi:putative intracellular protease/amidase
VPAGDRHDPAEDRVRAGSRGHAELSTAPPLKDGTRPDLGVDFTKGEMWKPYTVLDRNLFTGQNPASAGVLAERLLKVL